MLQEDRDFPVIPGELMPDHVSHELKQQIAKYIPHSKFNSFVGSQPVSFQSKHLKENLLNKDYFVCEKSDGLRCLMFCLLDPSQEEAVFLITRENQFYRIPNVHFPTPEDENSCHNGTLIDGELVISKRPDGTKELRYLMFDCLALNGRDLTQRKIYSRLGYLGDHFYKPYFKLREHHPKETEHFPFKLSMKNMHEAYKLPKVVESLKHLGHISDGLIFTCCETPYVFGTDQTLLKWKPSEENTIDFRLHFNIPVYVDEDLDERDPDRSYLNYDAKPEFELHVWQGDDRYSTFGKLEIPDKEWEELKKLNEPLEERIIECNKDENGNWGLLRFRDDKSNGNHISTVKKVMESIHDAVSREELIDLANEIERTWKQRAFERKNIRPPQQQQQHQPTTSHVQPQTRKRSTDESIPTYDNGDNSDDDDDDEEGSNDHKRLKTE